MQCVEQNVLFSMGKEDTSNLMLLLSKSVEAEVDMHNNDRVICSCANTYLKTVGMFIKHDNTVAVQSGEGLFLAYFAACKKYNEIKCCLACCCMKMYLEQRTVHVVNISNRLSTLDLHFHQLINIKI